MMVQGVSSNPILLLLGTDGPRVAVTRISSVSLRPSAVVDDVCQKEVQTFHRLAPAGARTWRGSERAGKIV